MDFYLSLAIAVATIFYGKYKQHSSRRHTTDINQTRVQEIKTLVSSSSPPCRNWEHHVFVSFRGEDVRKAFLSHILREFKRKGINPFIDNEMERGGSITPELKRAIKGSRIAIVLISKNYASSSWCLNELVKIIKCRRKIGQKVITIFYQVETTDVKKQTGEFGKVFKKTCKGQTHDVIQKWRDALTEVATITGYDSSNWVDEASAIEKVASKISEMLNHMAPSHCLDRLIGMDAHMKKMQALLRIDLVDEVRMIGIWGPPGIGKSTISRYLFNQFSNNFQLTAIMVNIKQSYPNPCLDEGSAQLQLQNDMLSKMINHKDIIITHLGAAQDRLKDKKVLLVLDDVDQHEQLVALAEDNQWFGPGSRIIIATENLRVLLTHGIGFDRIYKVNYPSNDEAFQMFCMYAFRQKIPNDGFTELAREVTYLVGNLPLGLQVMGSYFLRRPKTEWIKALPKLRSRLDGKVETILKFSYDALSDEYKDLFLHIACYFNGRQVNRVEAYLAECFMDVSLGLQVLADKSLISFENGRIKMHRLLVQLGQEIVHKQYIGKRKFVIGDKDTFEVLADNTIVTRSIIGLYYEHPDLEPKICFGFGHPKPLDWACKQANSLDELTITEEIFERISNLQFLTIKSSTRSPFTMSSYGCLINIPSKLRLLDWNLLPITCWPTNVKLEFLVELNMRESKLEKLWKGIKPLQRLKWMDLSFSTNLKKLPNLSTATSLEGLYLNCCSSLVKLPFSIGNATNLQILKLYNCSSLVKLPCSIGNATNLQELHLSKCSSLVELPSSIGNATNLQKLDLDGCSSLVELPCSIGNATNLQRLDLSDCSRLVELPCSIGNATNLHTLFLNDCSSLLKLPCSIGNLHKLEKLFLRRCSKLEFLPTNINMKQLDLLVLTDCLMLKYFPKISTNIGYLYLSGTAVEEVPSSIRSWSQLKRLDMSYNERFGEMSHVLDTITDLDFKKLEDMQELGTWIKGFTRLRRLELNGMRKLVSLPQLPDSLVDLDAENLESLERLDCSFCNPDINLNFLNCFKLNQEARDLIIQTSIRGNVILPGGEVPTYFNFRASGNILTVKLNEKENLGKSRKFRACVLMFCEGDWEHVTLYYSVASKYYRITFYRRPKGSKEVNISENLFIFDVKTEEVTSTELVFEFNLDIYRSIENWKIKEIGVVISSYGDADNESSEK